VQDQTIGRTLRALRRRLGWRQIDVAHRAGVSQQLISRIERGRIASVTTATLRRVLATVDTEVVLSIRWRGGQLDRLLDEHHAAIVGRIAEVLRDAGWQVITEATFSEYGERGSIDVLAWHASSRTLLLIEVKTEITSAEELLRRHDAKIRLGPKIGRERFGSMPVAVGRLLVIAESPTNRRRLDRLGSSVGATYPDRGVAVRRWLRRPAGSIAGVVFMEPPRTAGVAAPRMRRRAA
jgi:transcriptional regulator with XRE-family HTH domain